MKVIERGRCKLSLSDEQKISEVEAALDGNPLMSLQGYIILIKKPNDSNLYGPIEDSFSLNITKNQTFFYWDSRGSKLWREMDGKKWVEKDLEYWKRQHPDWEMKVYNPRDNDNLPIVIDWEVWLDAHIPSNQSLSGVKSKYWARNLQFREK